MGGGVEDHCIKICVHTR